jgi:AcrR family transcriptional regulator
LSDETRDRLFAAAKRQFAEKGFYGASIATIAQELGITKQALLYHFRRKEDLYAEVLQGISGTLLRFVQAADQPCEDPARRLETIFLNIYRAAIENPEDTRLLVRELLDNQARAGQAKTWYLVPFLDAIASVARSVPGMSGVSDARVFSFVYQVLGSIEYFVISTATLRRMYGDPTYERVRDQFPLELQDHVRRFLNAERRDT